MDTSLTTDWLGQNKITSQQEKVTLICDYCISNAKEQSSLQSVLAILTHLMIKKSKSQDSQPTCGLSSMT